jgi:hypothetical protein
VIPVSNTVGCIALKPATGSRAASGPR